MVGLPLSLSGTDGPAARAAREEAAELARRRCRSRSSSTTSASPRSPPTRTLTRGKDDGLTRGVESSTRWRPRCCCRRGSTSEPRAEDARRRRNDRHPRGLDDRGGRRRGLGRGRRRGMGRVGWRLRVRPPDPPVSPQGHRRHPLRDRSSSGSSSSGGLSLWVVRQINPPGDPGAKLTVTIDPGATTSEIADLLETRGVITNATRLPVVRAATRRLARSRRVTTSCASARPWATWSRCSTRRRRSRSRT